MNTSRRETGVQTVACFINCVCSVICNRPFFLPPGAGLRCWLHMAGSELGARVRPRGGDCEGSAWCHCGVAAQPWRWAPCAVPAAWNCLRGLLRPWDYNLRCIIPTWKRFLRYLTVADVGRPRSTRRAARSGGVDRGSCSNRGNSVVCFFLSFWGACHDCVLNLMDWA